MTRPHITGIILGAGMSTRMGQTKQLLSWGKTTLLGQVVENAKATCLAHIILVLGHRARDIGDRLDLTGIQVVMNPHFKTGQASSLKAGLAAAPSHTQAALFLLGDQPLVGPTILDQIIRAWVQTRAGIQIPYHRGSPGNPVVIHKKLFNELSGLRGDAGARALFPAHGHQIKKLELPHREITWDVDTWEAYQRLGTLRVRPGPMDDPPYPGP
ncbi:MAG: nucleotidyltransferase family protein [Desulfobacterales bacterium]|nr:nucleotidyltransferase family protein [Desulfobacterales bacterium]